MPATRGIYIFLTLVAPAADIIFISVTKRLRHTLEKVLASATPSRIYCAASALAELFSPEQDYHQEQS